MILGIENRTENWKTARTFGRMYPENLASLANGLLNPTARFTTATCLAFGPVKFS